MFFCPFVIATLVAHMLSGESLSFAPYCEDCHSFMVIFALSRFASALHACIIRYREGCVSLCGFFLSVQQRCGDCNAGHKLQDAPSHCLGSGEESNMESPLSRRDFLKFGVGCLAGATSFLLPSAAYATMPQKISDPWAFYVQKYDWHMTFDYTIVEPTSVAHPFTNQYFSTGDGQWVNGRLGQWYSVGEGRESWLPGCAVRFKGGNYKGTPIDMVMRFLAYSGATDSLNGYIYCCVAQELGPHCTGSVKDMRSPMLEFRKNGWVKVRFEFYYAGTNTPIRVAGHNSFVDLDWGEAIKFEAVDAVYVRHGEDFVYIDSEWVRSDPNRGDAIGANGQGVITFLYDTTSFDVTLQANPWGNSLGLMDSDSLISIRPPDPTKIQSLGRG